MKNRTLMSYAVPLTVAVVMLPMLNGCSAAEEKGGEVQPATAASEDHVWKTQTDALEKARQVEQVLQDSELERKKKIDDAIDP